MPSSTELRSAQVIATAITTKQNLDTADGGSCAIELWRGIKTSWQIINDDGYLYIRNNYNGTKLETYEKVPMRIAPNEIGVAMTGLSLGTEELAINDSYSLYTNGQVYFELAENTISEKEFCIGDKTDNYLSIAGTGIQAWNNLLQIQPYGGNVTIGRSNDDAYLVTTTNHGSLNVVKGLGLANTDGTSGLGISLYGGPTAGKPSYGIMFAETGTFGGLQNTNSTWGISDGTWATYLTMNDNTGRGWIFQRGNTNVAAINGFGTLVSNVSQCTHLDGARGLVAIDMASPAGHVMLARIKSTNGNFVLGTYNTDMRIEYISDALVTSGTNSTNYTVSLIKESGATRLNKLSINIDSEDFVFRANGDSNINGTLLISGITTGSWTEGIRINNASNGWTSLTMGGTDALGHSAATWSFHTYNNNFYLCHDGSSASSTGIIHGVPTGDWVVNNTLLVPTKGIASTPETESTANAYTSAAFGGTKVNISSAIYAPTSGIQIIAGAGGATNSAAIGFHNPGISSGAFGYYQHDANNGTFRILQDDTYWDLLVGGTTKLSTLWGKANVVIGDDTTDKIVLGYLASSTNGLVVGGHNKILSAWAPINISGTQVLIRENEVLVAKYLNGCLSLFPSNSSYREGIRIHSYGSWSDILLCGNDNTADAGTSANSWFLGNNNGNFYITRNGSSSGSAGISCVNNVWSISGTVNTSISGSAGYTTQLLGVQSNGTPYGATAANLVRAIWNVKSDNRWYLQSTGYECRVDYASNADTVDGYHASQLLSGWDTWVDLSSLNNDLYYPVTGTSLPYNGYEKIKVSVQLNSGTKPTWATHSSGFTTNVELYTTAWGWGTTSAETIVLNDTWGFTNCGQVVGYSQQSNNSMPVLWLRGGGKYHVYTSYNCTWTIRTSTYYTCGDANSTYKQTVAPQSAYPGILANGVIKAGKVYGAVWNDYAEYRRTNELVKPGQCVIDLDDGSLQITTARLQPGAQVVSDTFGFAIGETEDTKTPLAVSGRVLVYPYQARENYHAGQAVCSAPGGTVDIMTREEIREYPDCIIGIVSEIPAYETWGTGNVSVDGRIWIKIK